MSIAKGLNDAKGVILAIGVLGFIGIIFLMLYGNMSGNLGFSSGSLGYNQTEGVISNMTKGYSTFFGYAPTWFTIAAIVVLFIMFIGILLLVINKLGSVNRNKGFNE